MSNIEANIVLDLPDDVDPTSIIDQLLEIISSSNGKETRINVIEVDNPVSVGPINISKGIGE